MLVEAAAVLIRLQLLQQMVVVQEVIGPAERLERQTQGAVAAAVAMGE
jgi:hypothetical protein